MARLERVASDAMRGHAGRIHEMTKAIELIKFPTHCIEEEDRAIQVALDSIRMSVSGGN